MVIGLSRVQLMKLGRWEVVCEEGVEGFSTFEGILDECKTGRTKDCQ